jgi:DtxR family transcriptional regulator, Mn-dependent transcriptional regulator
MSHSAVSEVREPLFCDADQPPAVDRGVTRLSDCRVGTTAPIAYVAPSSSARIERLAMFGITRGSEVTLIARWPTCVLSCGGTSIAIDQEIADDIYLARMR